MSLRLSILTVLPWAWLLAPTVCAESNQRGEVIRDRFGAIVRGDVDVKKLSLVFTGDQLGESTGPILEVLGHRDIKAGFFITGNFLRRPELEKQVKQAIEKGHYVGPHSDAHPLYCSWEDRDKTLVTEAFFKTDLRKNLNALREIGAKRGDGRPIFIPPYEWYNRDQVRWSEKMGVRVISFTPGSGSNRDYAPEEDRRFVPSETIFDDILAYEEKDPHGLNGFILLLHLGSGREDPFHPLLGSLCEELTKRGYSFVRIDALCDVAPGN